MGVSGLNVAKKESLAALRYGGAGAVGVAVGYAVGNFASSLGLVYAEASGLAYLVGFVANYTVARKVLRVVRV